MVASNRIQRLLWRITWWWKRHTLASIEVVALDVDGVLTDGGLWYGPEGDLSKRFDVRDGLGIRLLQHAGVEVVFLSGGRGGATEVRARHLGVQHCLVGVKDKSVALDNLRQKLGIRREALLFLGDDLNDLAVQAEVALLVSTADGARPLRRRADAVLLQPGGHGAVRELAERLLRGRGLWAELSRKGWRDRND
ncbi:phosphatase [Synechococcus lacustris C3-12m-Tous]|uniref:KdsC family phosphatase n=1 Tax=Synechococcus lacustris TaxID=2116544 RepID=UPI0020CC724A|nr:phosphatase [Synechococcus lacustris]MCP9926110.1 phosphatase [Synechococcus lacustris C3-12m-Tous]